MRCRCTRKKMPVDAPALSAFHVSVTSPVGDTVPVRLTGAAGAGTGDGGAGGSTMPSAKTSGLLVLSAYALIAAMYPRPGSRIWLHALYQVSVVAFALARAA